jgi:hypothetical protein
MSAIKASRGLRLGETREARISILCEMAPP